MDLKRLLLKVWEGSIDGLLSLNPFLSKEVFTSSDARKAQQELAQIRAERAKLKAKYGVK